MYAEFNNDLITGDEMIDSQHRELIDHANSLLFSLENGQNKDEIEKMLRYLSEYTSFHFTAEEQLQRDLGYPGIAEHLKAHDELRKTVTDLQIILDEEGSDYEPLKKIVEKEILDWLCYHINGYDRSVAEFKFMRDNTERL